jgi:hypothetical protein
MIDFSGVPKVVLDEEIPLECGKCTFRFWRRLAELAQLQRDTLFAECPRCSTIIDIDEAEFEQAIRQLSGIAALRRDMAAD